MSFQSRLLWFFRAAHAPSALLISAAICSASMALVSCKKDKPSSAPTPQAETPTLRIYAISGAAGAVEPCGCVKDMLGGVDHAAAYIETEKRKAPNYLVLGAGPMFFENPQLEPKRRDQQLFKAEAMAQSLAEMGLLAWAPGANDWATGSAEFSRLRGLAQARALGANLQGSEFASHIVKRGNLSIGLVGISVPTDPTGKSPVESGEPQPALLAALAQFKNTDINIALIAAPRGQALRLIESINQSAQKLQIAILGKPYDQGENNDQPFTPEIIDNTLVVQAPNHMQALSVIDLYVRDGTGRFADGTGIATLDKQIALDSQIEEMSHRIVRWKEKSSQVSRTEIAKKEQELVSMRSQRAGILPAAPPKQGSYFLYDLVFVRESLGEEPRVSSRLSAYYKRVNEHNKVAFADRKPQPVAEGKAHYIGVAACSNCHLEERAFWNTTRHAISYSTLENANKEFNLDCVSCHVTGYEEPGGSTVTHVEELKSVQCEVCHGPGSLHAENPGAASTINAEPARSLCASSCHHAPHVGPDWSVDVAWPQIIGKGHQKRSH